MAENNAIEVHGREVIATRIFDAPRALVWRAFTDPDHLKHWWGPNGFTCTFHEFDLRPGGAWHFIMHGPDGKDYENEWVFVAVDWMERIVLDHTNFPRHRLTMRFEDVDGGKTKLTFQQVSNRSMITKRSSLSHCRASHKTSIVGLRICRRSIPTGAS